MTARLLERMVLALAPPGVGEAILGDFAETHATAVEIARSLLSLSIWAVERNRLQLGGALIAFLIPLLAVGALARLVHSSVPLKSAPGWPLELLAPAILVAAASSIAVLRMGAKQ